MGVEIEVDGDGLVGCLFIPIIPLAVLVLLSLMAGGFRDPDMQRTPPPELSPADIQAYTGG